MNSFEPINEWEMIYTSNGTSHKNRYPDTDVVSFVIKNFGHIPNRKSVKLLDVGCGWGNNLNFMAQEGFDVYGIDGSKTAIKNCMKITPNVVYASFEKLPFPDNFFNGIIDRNSIQCNTLDKISLIYQECYRVLKPKGIFFSIILAATNQPENFHAKYLKKPSDFLELEEIKRLLIFFKKFEIDQSKRTYNNKKLYISQYYITCMK